jgi:hypothetical protein
MGIRRGDHLLVGVLLDDELPEREGWPDQDRRLSEAPYPDGCSTRITGQDRARPYVKRGFTRYYGIAS